MGRPKPWLRCPTGCVALALVVGLCVPWGAASAQTYGVALSNVLMPASGGMAGTSVAAPQDFLSAINGNAAALTQFRGTHFTLGGAFAEPTLRLSQSANIPLLHVSPFSEKSGTPGSIVPAIGVSHELDGMPLPTTFGIGVMGAAGGGSSYVQAPESNGTSSYLLILEFAPSLAVSLTERLSIGATMFVGDGYASGPLLGVSSMTNAYSLGAGLGIDYSVSDATRLGAYYRSTQAFRFHDEVIPIGRAAPLDVDIGLPQMVGIGISNESLLDGRLLLAADALYLDWDSAAFFGGIYSAQWVLQLGTQLQATERVRLRMGYAYAGNPIDVHDADAAGPGPIPGTTAAERYVQAQYAIVNPHRLTAGYGYADVLPGLDFDAFAGGMFPATAYLGSSTRLDAASWWIGLGLTWRFDAATTGRRGTSS